MSRGFPKVDPEEWGRNQKEEEAEECRRRGKQGKRSNRETLSTTTQGGPGKRMDFEDRQIWVQSLDPPFANWVTLS